MDLSPPKSTPRSAIACPGFPCPTIPEVRWKRPSHGSRSPTRISWEARSETRSWRARSDQDCCFGRISTMNPHRLAGPLDPRRQLLARHHASARAGLLEFQVLVPPRRRSPALRRACASSPARMLRPADILEARRKPRLGPLCVRRSLRKLRAGAPRRSSRTTREPTGDRDRFAAGVLFERGSGMTLPLAQRKPIASCRS